MSDKETLKRSMELQSKMENESGSGCENIRGSISIEDLMEIIKEYDPEKTGFMLFTCDFFTKEVIMHTTGPFRTDAIPSMTRAMAHIYHVSQKQAKKITSGKPLNVLN